LLKSSGSAPISVMTKLKAGHLQESRGVESLVAQVFACSREIAEQVVRRGKSRHFPEQAAILRQGDWVAFAFLIVAGRAQALLYSSEGQVVLVHDFARGEMFGALGELDPVRQDADVIATEAVETLVLEAAQLVELAEKHGVIGLALSRMLIARLRQTATRMFERAALSALGRVYSELLREARRAPDFRISPVPVIAELALRVATTRETASRAVSALERRGIVVRDASSLTVVAPHRLEELII
jgi:CRP-like cAMP-binding protein